MLHSRPCLHAIAQAITLPTAESATAPRASASQDSGAMKISGPTRMGLSWGDG